MKRGVAVFRGSPDATAAAARALVGTEGVLWVGDGGAAPSDVKRLLGGTFDAVVLDLHAGFDPDLLGRAHGFVAAGGALVLRMPERPVRSAALAVPPYPVEDVGTRMWDRLERALARLEPQPYAPVRTFHGTVEQDALVERLRARLTSGTPARIALTADRGRGKSVALGRAAAGLGAVVTSAHPEQVREVLRFAPDARWVDPLAVARGEGSASIVLVDEAAALSVPLLQAVLAACPGAHLVLASTVHGYEGHGRGFSLRFLPTVPGLERHTLSTPIRWAPDDPLEAFVHEGLLLDAEPCEPSEGPVHTAALEGDALESRLRGVFGLLVAAHYRTTPSDLQRVLDAPNLDVHGLFEGPDLSAVSLVAREGGLSDTELTRLAAGERLRGHALAETLAVHSGRPDAARLAMIRSVRTAVHPDRRRRGLARVLVDHVHGSYTPDLFGTLFGATPALLAFRRSQGYRLVRLGVSRGSRTGEPSAVMVRPVSPDAHALVHDLRAVLARDLPLQLELMQADGLPLAPDLLQAVLADLPAPAPLDGPAITEAVRAYTRGSRPYDAMATALTAFVQASDLTPLEGEARQLVEARVLHRASWTELSARTGLPVPAVMRALRRAFRELTGG
ncbi:MAG: GNAT family N-acetyltransferase [Myxococcota bacterium]